MSDNQALADAIHSMGLKIGIYEDYGTKTCGGFPGTKVGTVLNIATFLS